MGEPSNPGGGVDVTVCLGAEEVTQDCKVLDTNAFDIVIGTDFLQCNPCETVFYATSQCPTLRLEQWPFLCPFGVFRTIRIRSVLSELLLLNLQLSVGATCLGKWTGRPTGRPE